MNSNIRSKIWACEQYHDVVSDRRYIQSFIIAKAGWRPYVEVPAEEPVEQNEEQIEEEE